jgi:hypothetical protein
MGECAFCGRADGAVRQVTCDDCQVHHKVCAECADEISTALQAAELRAAEAPAYRLVA